MTRKCDLLNDSQAWTDQQQLQTIYHQVLVLDLEYALDKKVEQELWTVGFKNHITVLQEQARDKKVPFSRIVFYLYFLKFVVFIKIIPLRFPF